MKFRNVGTHTIRLAALAMAGALIVTVGKYPKTSRAVVRDNAPDRHATKAATSPKADFKGVSASADVQRIADWAIASRDHENLPYIVVDKRQARAFVFDERGTLVSWTPALLGMGIGDTFEPGVTEMNMYQTKPSQRITPSGRFRAEEWQKPSGEWILWLDYSTQIAIHKLRKSQLALSQDREARLYSNDPRDSRVTYGCVNVPPEFYDKVITPTFNGRGGIVYVLPDSKSIETFFELYPARLRAARA